MLHGATPKLGTSRWNQTVCASFRGVPLQFGRGGEWDSTADFNALVEDLVKALDKLKVGGKEKDELLSVLGPMKSDIVEKPSALGRELCPSTIFSVGVARKSPRKS